MRLLVSLLLALTMTVAAARVAAQPAAPAAAGKLRVACIGDSITFGAGVKDRAKNSYPAVLQRLLGADYEVRNFGVSGRTLLQHGDFPYGKEKAYKQALEFNPDIVVIKLGTNDSKPQNWKFKSEFAADARALIASFRALPGKPRVLICLPVPAFKVTYGIDGAIIEKQQLPILRQLAFETGCELIDLHTAHLGKGAWYPDNIHPNAEGAASMARVVADVVGFKTDAKFDIEKSLKELGIETKVTSFSGYRQLAFALPGGFKATVVKPCRTAAGRPFAWRGEFFGHQPQTDLALLERGYHVVYVGAQNMLGAPPAMKIWEELTPC